MKGKPRTDEYRMKASEFDAMMRRALSAPPLQERKPKAAKKTRKKAAPKKAASPTRPVKRARQVLSRAYSPIFAEKLTI